MNLIKTNGKRLLCVIMEWQVKRLRRRHTFTIVAVAGSVGKTSTKLSIAATLAKTKKVRYQTGNYNDRLTVPLVIFGHENPSLFAIFTWLKILLANQQQIWGKYPHEIVVLELGTDGPGQIEDFRYLVPDLAVVTATTPEHMEFFKTVEAVAEEELSVASFSKKVLVNIDDVPAASLTQVGEYLSYGTKKTANYRVVLEKTTHALPLPIKIMHQQAVYETEINLMGEQGAKVALAAFVVAVELGLQPQIALDALPDLQAFSGRMRVLEGIKNSVLIDDSYNASPAAVKSALDVLYRFEAKQRIAILGTMNELGETSEESHREMGAYCDPQKLDLVVTIGKEAEKYTAPVAKTKGCEVVSFDSPYQAGSYVKEHLLDEAVVLVKGSQNRVFAEEALKYLLAQDEDRAKLVRQTDYWLGVKAQQFPDGEEVR